MQYKRSAGRETWNRLKFWDQQSTASERLSYHILESQGYKEIDPSHVFGGPDGTKDMKLKKDGKTWIGACFFSIREKNFNELEKKFLADLTGIQKNNAAGMAFVTNQELTSSKREKLEALGSPYLIDIFHLERIRGILDTPINYGVRADFLQIPMTAEENISFIAARDKKYLDSLGNYSEFVPIKPVRFGDVYFADLGVGIGNESMGTRPVVVVSNAVNNKFAPTVTIVPVTMQMTNRLKLPTHVEIGCLPKQKKKSVALVEQIKTISKMRLQTLITTLEKGKIEEIKKAILIQMDCLGY